MKQITVQGMHCDACKKLIMMELEDAGLEKVVLGVEVSKEEKKGVFTLNEGVSDVERDQIISTIDSMEGYSVL